MMKNKECDIVKDLIPNYIDNLTSKSSNEFIENHIETCPNCKEYLNNMKSNISIPNSSDDKKGINILKKYNGKISTLRIVLFFVVIIFIITFFLMYRNYKIYEDIQTDGDLTTALINNSNNLKYTMIIDNNDDSDPSIKTKEMEIFFKDNISGTIVRNCNNEVTFRSWYNSDTNEFITLDFTNKTGTRSINPEGDNQTISNGSKIILPADFIQYEKKSSFFEILDTWILKQIQLDGNNYILNDKLEDGTKIEQSFNKDTGLITSILSSYPDGSYFSQTYSNIEFNTVNDSYTNIIDLSEFDITEK